MDIFKLSYQGRALIYHSNQSVLVKIADWLGNDLYAAKDLKIEMSADEKTANDIKRRIKENVQSDS